MRKYLFIALIGLFQMAVSPDAASAQALTEPGVKITGEVTAAQTIHAADLKQFKQVTVIRKDRDGKDHTYSGVKLFDLLLKAGVTLGKDLRGENLTKFALIEASDGYQVIFTLAELDSEFTDRAIILADRVDNQLLPVADGPFRIIVQDEKKPARCIKQVTAIKIAFAK
ncbi:molybdopterin-binding protein [Pedobacter metabolipauper]|uniref:Molybdopterin-dependent oxidoreductase-like protein n=1 Tax=Pedobacter metabolipauper TaxID=425513 RepID=A0A4R6SYZ2_9SPHI|nr:molybdopterin-binding protein [Pedobacter metabolipauper]TDQ11272.1 hypothetical protein ATK78_0390 [Pedobacter metabolipauper]